MSISEVNKVKSFTVNKAKHISFTCDAKSFIGDLITVGGRTYEVYKESFNLQTEEYCYRAREVK